MLTKETIKGFLWDLVFIVAGSVCYAVAIGMFSDPNDIAPGGLTGVAILLNYLFDWIPVGVATIVMNVPLLIISWFVLSKSMVIRTLCGIVISSVLTDVVTPYVNTLFLSTIVEGDKDPLLVCIFGGALLGLGVGLILRRGGTTGGSEVISRLLEKKYPHMSVGTLILGVDAVVITLSAIVYGHIENALYAVVFVFVGSQIIDRVVYGGRSGKMMLVLSKKHAEITHAIIHNVNRGVTLLKSQGGYSGEDRVTLLVAVRKDELFRLRKAVFDVDPDAFVMVLTTDEVRGMGFLHPDAE